MNNSNFNSFSELLDYKNDMKLSSELIFIQYLSKIYINLLQRDENINYKKSLKVFTRELSQKEMLLSSFKNISKMSSPSLKLKKSDTGISLETFLEYMDIQEYIGERIFHIFNKSGTNKLNKKDFCEGLNELYYGDIKNLIKFTFDLADFNNDGIIYKNDMKLILVYIPQTFQKSKIKQINIIINIFFEKNIEKPEEGEEKQINFNTYLKYIEEYINSDKDNKDNKDNYNLINNLELYNYNAPFFYFISILSYLFKNCPFNKKNVEYFIYSKNKYKQQLYRNDKDSLTERKFLSTSKKDLNRSSFINIPNTSNKFDSGLRIHSNEKNKNKIKYAIEAKTKIDKQNLFKSKKSSSQINHYNENVYGTLRENRIHRQHDYIISREKKNNNKKINLFSIEKKLYQNSKINDNKNFFTKKKTISPEKQDKYSTKNISPSTNNNIINIKNKSSFLNKISASPDLFKNKNIFNISNKETNGSSNNNSSNELVKLNSKIKLGLFSLSKEKEKKIPLSVETKLKDSKNDLDLDEPEEFVLCEHSSEDDSIKINKNNSKDEEINKYNDSNEVFLYKINEDDNNKNKNILQKYYAILSEKEILFFSSDLKNELCDLWYIFKAYISTTIEQINGINYYSIIITFNNNSVKKLYFSNETICKNFSKRMKKSIKNVDFEENYEILEELGYGHFSKVYKCKYKATSEIYAVKIINKNKIKSKNLELIRQEKNYLKLIKHQNIISLKDYYESKTNIYLVTECYYGGDLLSFLINKRRENTKISEKMAAKIIKKIADGIRYLNVFGIIHRDIKPENIMFAEKNNISSLKIIDLGVCKTLNYGELGIEPIGTNGYISPEIYMHHNYSFKIDIWSLGVILYLLITGETLPFDDENMDKDIIAKKVVFTKQQYPDKYFGDKSKRLINLLDRMLEKDDKKRININELIKNNWFEIIKKG